MQILWRWSLPRSLEAETCMILRRLHSACKSSRKHDQTHISFPLTGEASAHLSRCRLGPSEPPSGKCVEGGKEEGGGRTRGNVDKMPAENTCKRDELPHRWRLRHICFEQQDLKMELTFCPTTQATSDASVFFSSSDMGRTRETTSNLLSPARIWMWISGSSVEVCVFFGGRVHSYRC